MVITLVTDQFYQNRHGTSISAQRLYNGLIKLGHTVRVVAIDEENKSTYSLKERHWTKTINKIINSQGFQFGKFDREVLEKAIKGADIVHIYLPFTLGFKTIHLCRELNVPCTAGFHILPENITSTLYLNKSAFVNACLWTDFKNKTYKYIKHIHTPSLMTAKQLQKHNFNANLHVISNGYNDEFKVLPTQKPDVYKDKIVIAMIGRFSREKRYDLAIKAVNASKYRDKIQLVFGGKGPTKNRIMKMAKCLPNQPVFDFFSRSQLISLFNYADLYIHPADVEIEGMTCIEAIACGCPPIVADSPKSATPSFTVHPQSLFKHGNYKDLADKIDWWIEHPQQLKEQRKIIAEHAQRFTIEKSLPLYIKMFEEAIADWDKNFNFKKSKQKAKIINNYNN